MAAALPMVVTDVGGNAEAITDGVTGFVVAPRNPGELGSALLRLANDGGLRKQMGQAARQDVEARFSIERCIAQYDALYRHLCGGHMPPELLVTPQKRDQAR
jgi:glycosyltransferase involved in cell wall biosynthesis